MRMINEKTNPSLLLNLDGKPSLISTSCLQKQVQGHIWIQVVIKFVVREIEQMTTVRRFMMRSWSSKKSKNT